MSSEKNDPMTISVIDGYALWAESYTAEAHNPLMEIEEMAVKSLLPEIQGKKCLDLACGSGRYLKWLKQKGARLVVGADLSIEMLKAAKSDSVVQSSFFPLPFADDTFDLIVCGLAVGHSPKLEQILCEATRVLRPQGILIYSDFHPFASLFGWQRTFSTNNNETYSLEHYTHLYQEHFNSCAKAGLIIEAVQEPLLGEHGPIEYAKIPVVLALRALKIIQPVPNGERSNI